MFVFVIFSSLLYADLIRPSFPFFSGMSGSDFMLHTNYTGISKSQVHYLIVVFLFLLYPVWIFSGYALALLVSKRRRVTREVFTFGNVRSKKERGPSTYAVRRGPRASECVRDALQAIGGIEKFVKAGDRVLIKINICGGVPEIKGTFTSTEVAGEVVDLVRSAGGEPIVADADMIWTKFWQAARDSGWMEWAKTKGVRLVNLSETSIVGFDFGRESALGVERVSRELVDANVIISIPTMKTHLLTGVTLGMKNMYGTFPEIDKARYHRMGIEETIYMVNKAFTPTLVIIDGSVGGEAIGPLSCRPVSFQTIIASNDVVTADSVACRLMGYDPRDVVHVWTAHQRGLGDALLEFDQKSLPYPHPGGKDGNWDRPDPAVKDFYEWAIELLLRLPGWETLFNVGADFFLYDLARLPVFRYLTPALLQLLNDAVYLNIKDLKDTKQDRKRRRVNMLMLFVVALASLAGFYQDGYLMRSTLLFVVSFLLAIGVAMIGSARMKTKNLVALLVSASLFAILVEHTNTQAGLLAYTGSPDVSLFIVCGWMVLMVAILQISDLLAGFITRLGAFQKLQDWGNLPFGVGLVLFVAFMSWERYLDTAEQNVILMYAFMLLIGLLYSSKHSIEWNASLLMVSLVAGGYMELLGSLDGFWVYRFHEPLAMFFALSWTVNAWAVHGLVQLMGVDLGAREDRKLTGLSGKSEKQL